MDFLKFIEQYGGQSRENVMINAERILEEEKQRALAALRAFLWSAD